jgi:hypothetical protein
VTAQAGAPKNARFGQGAESWTATGVCFFCLCPLERREIKKVLARRLLALLPSGGDEPRDLFLAIGRYKKATLLERNKKGVGGPNRSNRARVTRKKICMCNTAGATRAVDAAA